MGIDALRDAVEEEARAHVSTLLEDAHARAGSLRAEAAEESAARLSLRLREEEARLRAATAARISAARHESQARLLEARDELLERVFALAHDHLPAVLDTPPARQWLIDLAEQAIGYISSGPVRIECSSDVVDWLAQAFSGRDGIRIEQSPELPCGFRARGPNDDIVVDATLTKLLEVRRPKLAIEVLQGLQREEAS